MPNQTSPWTNNKPPSNYEKLWRGIILVAAIHLLGMGVNLICQMSGYYGLDRIPAQFLGL